MSEIFQALLDKRGLTENDLMPKYEELADPFLLPDMDKCIEGIMKAINAKEKILIYGDYDVDGVTAAALMYQALKMAGAVDVDIVLPDRFEDGYGMSTKIVQKAVEEGVKLVVTVDCGSSNEQIISSLLEHKIYTIVTDHHELLNGTPKSAIAVVNPKREDLRLSTKFNNFAGVGVAFEVARALVKMGRIPEGKEKWLMDLVVIGSVADRMVMRGENWKICYFGMIVLKRTRRKGLKKLMKIAGIKEVSSEVIGFGIAPRLNAAGRMQSAQMALKLMLVEDELEAEFLANELNDLNMERKKVQNKAIKEMKIEDEPVIVTHGECHEGVIGIVAGRLVEKYKKPVFVFTSSGDNDEIKCSGRSFGDFNLAESLKEVENLLIKGGGHAAACGATIKKVDFQKFKEKINEFYKKLDLVDQERFLEKKADLEIFDEKIDVKLAEELERLEPFGNGNESPIFCKKNATLSDVRLMGKEKNHMSFLLDGVKFVYFFVPEEMAGLQNGDRVNVKFEIGLDEWNGVKRVSARVVQLTPRGDFI